jgi:hypothetical protein
MLIIKVLLSFNWQIKFQRSNIVWLVSVSNETFREILCYKVSLFSTIILAKID